jgi:hypothetical protein
VQLDPTTPRTVRIAGVLVCLQGLIGVVFAVVLIIQPGVLSLADRAGEAGFFLLMAAAVIGFGVALVLGKRGARSPAIVVELLLTGIAGYVTVPSRQAGWGILIAAFCIYTLYLLLNANVRDWAMDREPSDKDPD